MAVKKVTPSQGIFFEITPQDIEGMQFEQIAQMLHQKGIKNKIKFFTPKCKEDGPKHPFSSDGAAVEFLNSLNKRLVELRGMELVAAGISSSIFVRFPTGQITTQLDPIFRILFFALGRILCIIGLYIPELIHSMILDGRLVAATILENIQQQITRSTSHDRPMLAVVLVGENPASLSYIRMKEKRAREVGMGFGLYRYDATITQGELETAVRELSANDKIHGIIVQSPLPSHIDPYAVIDCIDPDKDVDGFTRSQIGNMFLGHDGLHSCTPKGIMTMLKYYHIDVSGKSVAVIGRSNIVGKPMTLMLVNAGATVTSCNSKTSNLSEITQKADIIIVAAGKPGLLTRDMVTPRSIVIDVGCTFVDGIACGDTDFENIKDSVTAISPVPGGVGPMTVATLIENTWKAFQMSKENI